MTLLASHPSVQAAGVERDTVNQKILAPVDLSGEPGPALDFAVKLARAWNADLYVLHVYAAPVCVAGPHFIYAVGGVDWCRHQSQSKLIDWVERLRPQHARTFPLFEDGECPAKVIQEVAGSLRADLIVISTHDRAFLSAWILYSDADELARNAATPVLIFRPKEEVPRCPPSREEPGQPVRGGYDRVHKPRLSCEED